MIIVMVLLIIAVIFTLFFTDYNNKSVKNIKKDAAVSAYEPDLTEFNPLQDDRINFDELLLQNSDVISWIELPGTVIDYPVMRGIDNSYYLTHTIEKKYYVGGSIFADMSNSADFSDPVTVLYGHYMPDKSIFTQLHNFKEKKFFDKNREVFIHLPNKTLQYEIVAGFNIGEENILYKKDYRLKDTMQEFIDLMKNTRDIQARLRLDNATIDDKYIVLSTCQSEQDNATRFIVIARLVEEVVV